MNRPFLDRLHNPDEDFPVYLHMLAMIIPLGTVFLIMFIIIIIMIVEISMASTIKIPQWSEKIILYSMAIVTILPYIVLKIMQSYISIKLKKMKCVNSK